jgi:hypothetical protein
VKKRTPRRFAIPAVAACLFGIVLATPVMAPTAHADTLPNGYSITCTPNGSQVICNISGCPRVQADEAGDVVHVMANGDVADQRELSKGCNNTTTTTYANSATTISVQGCRKHSVGTDDCGAWSDFVYTPPPPAATGPTYAPQAPQTAHVVGGDMPVFNIAHDDVKDPTNGVQGLKIATLPNGTDVGFDGVCKSGWCHIKSPLIPTGEGFAEENSLLLD